MATPIGPSDQECTLTMTRKKELSELCHPTKNKQTKVTDLTTIIIIFMGNTLFYSVLVTYSMLHVITIVITVNDAYLHATNPQPNTNT